MPQPYRPPRQGRAGQIFDCFFLLTLVYLALYLPLKLGLAGGGKVVEPVAEETWQALGQNQVMQAQWEKLGFDPKSAGEIITSKFDYSISAGWLVATAIILVGYFAVLLIVSEREYRQVIAEKFGTGSPR